jgi:hypothetical protein
MITCESNELEGGEHATVFIEKTSEAYDVTVPNEAVHSGEFGTRFVWVLHQRSGGLGTEYYTVKANVTVADMDETSAAISRGLEYNFFPIIESYDKSPTVNGRVTRME